MKNTKVFTILFAVLGLVVTGLSFRAINEQPEEIRTEEIDKPAFLYESALKSREEGDEEKALQGFKRLVEEYEDERFTPLVLEELGDLYRDAGEYVKAQGFYRSLLRNYPELIEEEQVQEKLDHVRNERFKEMTSGAEVIEYTVQPGDSLSRLAGKFNTTVNMIKNMNDLRSDTIRIGQTLKISSATFSVLVNKTDNILKLKKDGEVYKTYDVATGKDNRTPEGKFTITEKLIEPPWTRPQDGKLILPDSDEYELGKRWMAFDKPGYGIHGTNDESTIGQHVTQGCVRMKNDDVIELYDIIPRGTKVEIKK